MSKLRISWGWRATAVYVALCVAVELLAWHESLWAIWGTFGVLVADLALAAVYPLCLVGGGRLISVQVWPGGVFFCCIFPFLFALHFVRALAFAQI